MPKIVVVPLSLCIDTVMQRSIDAFAKLGVKKHFMLLNWYTGHRLNTLFNHYRTNIISSGVFKQRIIRICEGIDLSNGKFEEAWNAQCLVTEKTRNSFEELESLVARGIKVYILSSTNELHLQSILAQYGKPLPGISYFSTDKGKLDNALRDELVKELYQKYPELKPEDLTFLYSKPGEKPYANWGPFGWLLAPFQRLSHHHAESYVARLEKDATQKKFSLLPCQFSQKGGITRALSQMGWRDTPEIQSQPLLLSPRHHERYSFRKQPTPVKRFSFSSQTHISKTETPKNHLGRV